jgi:DNA-binding HxlR family transcriptional regulator
VLREAFFGITRFDDFHRALGCARNLLSERLAKLVEYGVLERVEYQEPDQRRRHEYRLTEKGLDLQPALVALMQWGTAGRPARTALRSRFAIAAAAPG